MEFEFCKLNFIFEFIFYVWIYFKIVGIRGYVGGLWIIGERFYGKRVGVF